MDVKANFFQRLAFNPAARHSGKELNEAFDRGVWLAKGHAGSFADSKRVEGGGEVEVKATADQTDLSFNYLNGKEVAGDSLSMTQTAPTSEGGPAKTVSISLSETLDGKTLHVHRFEALEGQGISDAKMSHYLVDRTTGAIFEEVGDDLGGSRA